MPSELAELLSDIRKHPKRGVWILFVWLLFHLTMEDIFTRTNKKLEDTVGTPLTIFLRIVRVIAGWSISHPVELFLVFAAAYILWVLIRAQLSTRKEMKHSGALSVKLHAIFPSPSPVERGEQITVVYEVESESDVISGAWLGANVSPAGSPMIFNTKEDKSVKLVAGRHSYSRFLTIPENAPLGTHPLSAAVFLGAVGEFKKSTSAIGVNSPLVTQSLNRPHHSDHRLPPFPPRSYG
jgi:hypothetical protein